MSAFSSAFQQILLSNQEAPGKTLPAARLKECCKVASTIIRIHRKLDPNAVESCWIVPLQTAIDDQKKRDISPASCLIHLLTSLQQKPQTSKKRSRTDVQSGKAVKKPRTTQED